MAPFDWADPLRLEDQLTDEERMIRDAAHGFAQGTLQPRVIEAFRDEIDAPELFRLMGEAGLLGVTIPEEFGGAGAGYVAYGLVAREIERVDSGYRSMASVQSSLVMYPIEAYGTPEQKTRYLPGLARGELIGCFGLTEPDAGSDPGSMRTVAKKDGDGFRLSGSKTWITNSPFADVFVVWAKSEAHGGKIRGFVLDKGLKGLSAPKIEGKLSLRASTTGEIVLDDVAVGAEALLPGVEGLKGPLSCLTQARYGIAWGTLGSAMATYGAALEYSKSRKQWKDRPIAAHQLVQERLAWMITEITKGQLLAWKLGRMKDDKTMKPHHVSMAKRNNAWVARECAKLARETLGANGVVNEYPVFRHLANIESVYTYEGTHDIHTLIIGEAVTGVAAYNPPME